MGFSMYELAEEVCEMAETHNLGLRWRNFSVLLIYGYEGYMTILA